MKKLLCSLLIVCALAYASIAQTLVLGNPSRAANSDQNNFLVAHRTYVLSYNRQRGGANWVMWHLSSSDIGDVDRANFAPDPLLPRLWRITPSVYTNSNFDRGHLCPSKDRSNTDENNRETFFMSNMAPQTARLNQVTWKSLEDDTRDFVKDESEAYIIAGCYGSRGRIRNLVTIPTNCFKIVVLLSEGENDLRRIDRNTTVIAVDMPNIDNPQGNWKSYITSVDAIEARTGFDFLSRVRNDIESFIERTRYRP